MHGENSFTNVAKLRILDNQEKWLKAKEELTKIWKNSYILLAIQGFIRTLFLLQIEYYITAQ